MFNIDAPETNFEVVELNESALSVFAETGDSSNGFLEQIGIRSLTQLRRNVYVCQIETQTENDPALLRFRFDLEAVSVRDENGGMTALEYLKANNFNFVGYDGDTTVTAFFTTRARLG